MRFAVARALSGVNFRGEGRRKEKMRDREVSLSILKVDVRLSKYLPFRVFRSTRDTLGMTYISSVSKCMYCETGAMNKICFIYIYFEE